VPTRTVTRSGGTPGTVEPGALADGVLAAAAGAGEGVTSLARVAGAVDRLFGGLQAATNSPTKTIHTVRNGDRRAPRSMIPTIPRLTTARGGR